MTVEWNQLPETHALLGGPFHGRRVVMHHARSMYFEVVDGDSAPKVAAYTRTPFWCDGHKYWQYVFDPDRSHRDLHKAAAPTTRRVTERSTDQMHVARNIA